MNEGHGDAVVKVFHS